MEILKHTKTIGLMLIIGMFIISGFSPLVSTVSAQTPEEACAGLPAVQADDCIQVQKQSPYYSGLQPGTIVDTCATGSTILTGNNNVEKAYTYFVSNGLSPEQSAGVVGNLMAESSTDLDPTTIQGGGTGPGTGIAQWEDGASGRWNVLEKYAASRNLDKFDLGLQLDYILFEMTGNPVDPSGALLGSNRANAYTPLVASTTVRDATIAFMDKFETPAVTIDRNKGINITAWEAEVTRRTKYADSVLASFGAGGTGTIGAVQTTNNCNSAGGSVASGSDCIDSIVDPDQVSTITGYGRLTTNTSNKGLIQTCAVERTQAMLDAANADGIKLNFRSTYRSPASQRAIRVQRCGPVPVDSQRLCGDNYGGSGATVATHLMPGASKHLRGLAIDFRCDGSIIGRYYSTAKNNKCFQWLVKNANNYGFYEYGNGANRSGGGYEGWHWWTK